MAPAFRSCGHACAADVPERYLKATFYEAFFSIEEVAESQDPKRVNLFSFEPNVAANDPSGGLEQFRGEYVLAKDKPAD